MNVLANLKLKNIHIYHNNDDNEHANKYDDDDDYDKDDGDDEDDATIITTLQGRQEGEGITGQVFKRKLFIKLS